MSVLLTKMNRHLPYEVLDIFELDGWYVVPVKGRDSDKSGYFTALGPQHDISKMIMEMWVHDSCQGACVLSGLGAIFKSMDDAMLFRLHSPIKTPS